MGGRNGQGVIRVQTDEPTVEYAGQICSWGIATNQKKRGTNEDWPSTQGVHGAIGGTDIHVRPSSAQAPGRRHAAAVTKPRITDRGRLGVLLNDRGWFDDWSVFHYVMLSGCCS